MVDSNITENFISLALAHNKKFFICIKKDAYNLMIIDKNPLKCWNKNIYEKIGLPPVAVQQHNEEIIFDVI